MKTQETATEPKRCQLVALTKWRIEAGVSDITVWRWRKRGWLNPVNICGRMYLTSADLDRFGQRAAAGEFAQAPTGAAAGANNLQDNDDDHQ